MIKKLFFICFVFLMTSCQTYTSENSTMRQKMYGGEISEALKNIDKSSIATQNRNYVLFRMEKGMLQYLERNYPPATVNWLAADKKLDDLYTLSLSKTASTMVVNDTLGDYTGEAHERILLPIFLAMAYFSEKNLENALVMTRRTYDVLNSLNDEKAGKNTLKYDIFSHYFSALVYEADKEYDNAIIEYNLALQNLQKQNSPVFQEAKFEILKQLKRLAEYKKRYDILNIINKENVAWETQERYLTQGEVYIVYESGNSPIKVPEDIFIPTGRTVARLSFPVFQSVPYFSHYSDVYLNGQYKGRTILMENIGQMAQWALEERRARDIVKMTARVIAKDIAAQKLAEKDKLAGGLANVFNVLTEVADTRSWTSLPDTLQVFRILVEANKTAKIELKPQTGNPITLQVKLKAGEKYFYRFRTFN